MSLLQHPWTVACLISIAPKPLRDLNEESENNWGMGKKKIITDPVDPARRFST